MQDDRASRTAEHNALFRTLEAGIPSDERLFVDPLAPRFLTWPLSLVGRTATLPVGGRAVRRVIDGRWPGVRTSVVARTRLIDDVLEAMGPDELGQLVILGAGYDCRPYRLGRLKDVPVFEVDHPATQRAKRRILDNTLQATPDNVQFIATDFNLGQLQQSMEAVGFSPSVPTVYLWEGVSNYLSQAAVDATLRWCGRSAPGSTLLFTYVHADVLTQPDKFVGADRWHASLRKVDERITFGMDPVEMDGFLAARGLVRQWDLGASEYRARYFGDRSLGMVGHEFYRLALARIDGDRPDAGGAAGHPSL